MDGREESMARREQELERRKIGRLFDAVETSRELAECCSFSRKSLTHSLPNRKKRLQPHKVSSW